MRNLRKVELGYNNSSIEGVLHIVNVLRTCSNILDIQVSDGGFMATIRFLKDSTSIPMDRPPKSVSPVGPEGSQETVLSNLSLVKCKLTEKHVHTLCTILQHGPQLASLDLSRNELKDNGLRKLVEFLPEFRISKLINLSNNDFSANCILCLVTVLKENLNVLEIEVSLKCPQTVLIKFTEHREGTDCRDERIVQLMDFRLSSTGDSRSKPTRLRKLSLTSCCFQPKHLEELICTLENCSDLSELDLSDNSLGDRGFSKLVELLPKLHVGRLINVSNNFITMTSVFCLTKCMNKIRNLTEVAISLGKRGKGFIKFHGDHRFQKERKDGKQGLCLPKKISLEECEIDGETMRQLCLILKTCSALTELDLSNNALSNEAIAELLHHLPDLQDLETLNITDNSIPSDTVLLLAESLNFCENAQEVEVRSSGRASINFAKKGGRLEGSRKKAGGPCSRILSLRECHLHKTSMEQLFKTLERCKNLAEVDLSCNFLEDEGLRSLRDFLPKLHVLKLLDVSNNRISPTGVLYLVESLNTCKNVVEVEVSLALNGKSFIKFATRCEKKVCSVKECNLKGKDLLKFFSIVGRCTHLTELKLTSNAMGDEDMRNLVEVVGNLRHLEELDLQKNGISLAAVENLFVALKYSPKTLTVRFEEQWIHGADAVNLVMKRVQTQLNIAEVRIKKNQALIKLMADGWETSDSTRIFNEVTYPSLGIISLQQCGMEALHLVHLSSIIKRCPHLMELHLCQNNFGNEGAEILAEVLQVVRGLRNLSLESTNMSNTGMMTLMAGLCKCHSLEELNLSHNELGEESVSELGKILPGLEQLKIINLKSNSIGCKGAADLANGLKYSTVMGEINLSDNCMGNVGAMKLADVLPIMKSLKILNLTQNNITAIGGQRLAEALRQCPSVEEVDLSRNKIGDQTAMELAKALPKMLHLKILNLHCCGLGTGGGLSLAQGLVLCPTLQEISLAENNIGNEGVSELALALRSLKSLKKLSLQLNRVDNSMAKELATGLVCCLALEEVILSWNNISDEGATWLAEVLPRMRCLKNLDLEGNKITSAGAEKLAARLWQCSSIEVIRLWKNNILKERAQSLWERDSRLHIFPVYSSTL
ncbi:protein NLRC5-like [Leucoraja erinacea]|uniref:protein NLRC5-like n=1 Tax=Leucoraja erinaceus TaxID=7782 RepID=UPI00245567A3|nr:protein NLRC5-like [Leucoraja erinacea]